VTCTCASSGGTGSVRRDSQDKNTQDMPKRSEGVISSPERLPRDSKPSISTIDKGKNRLEPAKGTAQHSTARGECSDDIISWPFAEFALPWTPTYLLLLTLNQIRLELLLACLSLLALAFAPLPPHFDPRLPHPISTSILVSNLPPIRSLRSP